MIDNIPTFVKLAELESYTLTAEHFNTTKGTISKRIAQLEVYLNKVLILRTTKTFALTDDGKYAYDKFRLIPTLISETYKHFNQLDNVVHGTVKALLPAVLSSCLITPYINYFKELYPNITLNIIFSPEQANMRNYDIALTPHVNSVNKKQYDIIFARTESVYFYCTIEYAKKYGVLSSIDEIGSHNIISAVDYATNNQIQQLLITNKYTKEVYSIDVSHAQINVVPADHAFMIGLQHEHIFWGYESMCDTLIKTGKVIKLLPEYCLRQLDFYFVTRKTVRKEERVFIDFLRRCLNGMIKADIENLKTV